MPRAIWKGATLAESDDTRVVEGNHYFPAESIRWEHFEETATTSRCGWKGDANYYTVVVGEERNPDAAWVYREPLEAAEEIRGHLAFWKGVEVAG